ncbi:MAG: helix-turn-helix domain-containing protein [Armatimonadota bacterium]
MNERAYDLPITEVAKILEKSDRQVRRYVKERRLAAKPVRIDGHIKLMFNKDEVEAFRDGASAEGIFGESGTEILVDAQLIDRQESEPAVKYVIDALRDQLNELRDENKDLHYQLEQRSGQVGFLQAKIEDLQEEVKALAPAPKEERRGFFARIFRRE